MIEVSNSAFAEPVAREAVRNFIRFVVAMEGRRGDNTARIKLLTSNVFDLLNKKKPARYFNSPFVASDTRAFVVSAVRSFQPSESAAQYVYYCRPDLNWGLTPDAVGYQIKYIKQGHGTTESIRNQHKEQYKMVEHEWAAVQHGKFISLLKTHLPTYTTVYERLLSVIPVSQMIEGEEVAPVKRRRRAGVYLYPDDPDTIEYDESKAAGRIAAGARVTRGFAPIARAHQRSQSSIEVRWFGMIGYYQYA